MKNLKTKLERARRADHHFAVASVALMVFMVVAGFGAWMFGNSRAAAVDSPARHSTVRLSTPPHFGGRRVQPRQGSSPALALVFEDRKTAEECASAMKHIFDKALGIRGRV